MNMSISKNNNIHTIALAETFDFENHKDFRSFVKEAISDGANKIVVDFNQVKYIDSSALGMLMLAKHEVSDANCSIELTNLSGHAKNVLQLVKFDDKFNMA